MLCAVRVKRIPQTIAKQVECQNGERNGDTRDENQMRGIKQASEEQHQGPRKERAAAS